MNGPNHTKFEYGLNSVNIDFFLQEFLAYKVLSPSNYNCSKDKNDLKKQDALDFNVRAVRRLNLREDRQF